MCLGLCSESLSIYQEWSRHIPRPLKTNARRTARALLRGLRDTDTTPQEASPVRSQMARNTGGSPSLVSCLQSSVHASSWCRRVRGESCQLRVDTREWTRLNSAESRVRRRDRSYAEPEIRPLRPTPHDARSRSRRETTRDRDARRRDRGDGTRYRMRYVAIPIRSVYAVMVVSSISHVESAGPQRTQHLYPYSNSLELSLSYSSVFTGRRAGGGRGSAQSSVLSRGFVVIFIPYNLQYRILYSVLSVHVYSCCMSM